jgi:hypothetical protein
VDDFAVGNGRPGPVAGALYRGLIGRMEEVGATV